MWWTEEQAWFTGTVTSTRAGLTRVLYDAVAPWGEHAARHDLGDEVWEAADACRGVGDVPPSDA